MSNQTFKNDNGATVTISSARRGVAGQVAYATTTFSPDYGATTHTEFVGSTYGTPGPVVMATAGAGQVFVTDPGRFGGTFDLAWVKRFFGVGE